MTMTLEYEIYKPEDEHEENETGNTDKGLIGSLGDGSGKWHLQVSSELDLKVQSLLDTPKGFLTNLSRPVQ